MTEEVTDAMAPKSWLGGLEAEKCPYDTPKGTRGDLHNLSAMRSASNSPTTNGEGIQRAASDDEAARTPPPSALDDG